MERKQTMQNTIFQWMIHLLNGFLQQRQNVHVTFLLMPTVYYGVLDQNQIKQKNGHGKATCTYIVT